MNFFADRGFQRNDIAGGGRGGFDAGKIDRFNESWNPGQQGPNSIHQSHGTLLRQRAWDLYRNNPFARSAVNSFVDNVIECGILPKPQYKDRAKRQAWQAAFDRWAGVSVDSTRESDLSGHDTFHEQQAAVLREIVVGGGVLVHYVETERRGRTLPLAIDLLSEDRFAEDILQSGRNPKTSNPVLRGVEIDPSTGRHLAYHVRKTQPNDLHLDLDSEPQRIPARNADYLFVREQDGQHRGFTLLKTAVLWLRALGYYTDAELKASDLKSSWAYMVLTSENIGLDWPDLADSDPETGTTDIHGNKIEKVEPGMIWRGFPGDKIEPVGPNVPSQDSLPWIRLMQLSIAIGLGLSYQEMMRDYSQSNFHSSRAASNRDKKVFRRLQKFVTHRFVNPTVRRFTEHAVRAGLDGFPAPSRFDSQRDLWLNITAQPPGWESANPLEDAKADDVALGNGSTNLRRIAERKGHDWEDELTQQAQEEVKRQELEEQNGVTLVRPHAKERSPDGDADVSTGSTEDAAGQNSNAVRS